jgi:Ras-related protein Rab-7A
MKLSYKIVIIGDCNVGKTSLMRRYVNNSYTEQYKSTIGIDFLTKNIKLNNKIAELQIWDTAGSERFYSVSSSFYRGTDACVIVFDLTNINSFNNLEKWIDDFILNCAPKDIDNFPFVIIGNKSDLVIDNRKISFNSIRRFCENKNIKYFETSSKLNSNIESSFNYLINKMISNNNIFEFHIDYDMQVINLDNDGNDDDEENNYDNMKKINNSYKKYCICNII